MIWHVFLSFLSFFCLLNVQVCLVRQKYFFFFLLTYRNKNPYTGIIVIYCCCCFSCLLFLLCIDNFTDCHFLFYVCFFSLSHLVEYGDRWEYVLTSYWDLSLHAHKQTNTRISLWKKGPRHFSSAPFQRQLSFYYIFLHVIYTSYGCGVLERLPKAWCIMTGPGSQLLLLHVLSCLFPPSLSLRLISLTVRLITRASGIISESPS